MNNKLLKYLMKALDHIAGKLMVALLTCLALIFLEAFGVLPPEYIGVFRDMLLAIL